ncbi:MAG: hypothetical protein RLN75_03600, partial [Longimicrobiales bacterium]
MLGRGRPDRRHTPAVTGRAGAWGVAAGIALLGLTACADVVPELAEAAPGEPLPGLTTDERQRFLLGQAAFNRAFTPADGLGPLFNQARCSSCHDLPTSGGHGAEPVRKVATWDPARGCDPLTALGGTLLQRSVTPEARAAGLGPELIPAEADLVVELVPPPLYGLGLVAAVPLERIAAAADPDDTDGDGISGRLAEAAGGGAGL